MTMRAATMQDIPAITELRLKMLQELAFVPEDLHHRITAYLERHIFDETCLCILMEHEGQIIANAALCLYEVMPDEINLTGKTATLFNVYTLPGYRGKGYMKILLGELLNWAQKKGVKEILANAEPNAMSLYEHLGFNHQNREMQLIFSETK